MTTLCPENVSAKRKNIIKGLVEGKVSAYQLKLLIQKPLGPEGHPTAEELLANILRSFTQGISVLTSSEAGAEAGLNSAIAGENGSPAATASCNGGRSDDSGESRKRSSPAIKDRRGSYKRRRTEHTWNIVSPTTEDIHAWRKYGQKEILNSKFPRSYFRCTRKHDQGCKATKQVQRIQENPEMYQTTYIGLHTCKDILKAPEIVTDSGTWESLVLESKVPKDDHKVHGPPLVSSSSNPIIKQEYLKEDTPLSGLTDNLDLWSDLKDFELSEPSLMPSKMVSDHNANTVYSSTGGTVDFGVESVGFGTGDHFHFD